MNIALKKWRAVKISREFFSPSGFHGRSALEIVWIFSMMQLFPGKDVKNMKWLHDFYSFLCP